MSKFASLLAVTLACADGVRMQRRSACGVKGPSTNNGTSISIVNGEPASECEWNWQVGLRTSGRNFIFCGGMLINSEWVLTAAHCGNSATFDVVVGEFDKTKTSGKEQVRQAVQVINHPGYNSNTMHNDLSLVRLSEPVNLGDCVGSVCLPTRGADVEPGTECWITGWGTLKSGGSSPNVLQQAKVNILSNEDCMNKYDYGQGDIHSSMLCANGKSAAGGITDACQGDSGGPLVCETDGKWTLYGATSWGYGCADKVYPGVWARVHEGLDWIDETLDANQGPAPALPSCPDFAKNPFPDSDGDCQCPSGQYCSTDGESKNCPTSGSIGGYGGTWFRYTCENCQCVSM